MSLLSNKLLDLSQETYVENMTIQIEELFLKSNLLPNQTKEQWKYCRLPQMELIGHDNQEKYVKCKMDREWGYLSNNRWYFNQTVIRNFRNTQCKYRNVTRLDDFNLNYSPFSMLINEQSIQSEVIEVFCIAINFGSKVQYNNLHVQIVARPVEVKNDQIEDNSKCLPLNIILLSYDSISRVSWFKRLSQTTKFLVNEMKFQILYGQGILGDGTPACMIPLLTGKTERELPSTLKSDPDGKYVDQAYPFIWNDLHPKGFLFVLLIL